MLLASVMTNKLSDLCCLKLPWLINVHVPVMRSIEQWLPRLTLILTVFFESTVSVVYYFSKLLVQMFPMYGLFQIPISFL